LPRGQKPLSKDANSDWPLRRRPTPLPKTQVPTADAALANARAAREPARNSQSGVGFPESGSRLPEFRVRRSRREAAFSLSRNCAVHGEAVAAPNLTRIVVKGSTTNPLTEWLSLHIDPAPPDVFT
jgi:hypothetical protein